jgi:tetratricopeptide (TPR) repeat protein
MSLTPRCALLGLFFILAGPVAAQTTPDDRPERYAPKTPLTRQQLDHQEALLLYAQGAVHEREHRLVEAVHAYEAAARLDPESAAVPRALAPVYLALERTEEALSACRKTLRLDPGDFKTGYLLARQLRGQDRLKEAVAVLKKTVRAKGLAGRPDLAVQIWSDLALMQEKEGDLAGAEKSLRHVTRLFDNAEPLVESGLYTSEEVGGQAADAYERLGKVCLKAKAVDRAVRAFESAQKKDSPRAPRLAFNLARVLRDRGKYRDALAQLETYLSTQPQGVEGYEMRIDLQRKLRLHARIVPELAEASRRDSNNLALRLLLAREYRKAGKQPQAEGVYTELLSKYPTPEVYRGLFELYKEEGQAGAERILTRLDAALEGATPEDKKPANATDAANAQSMLAVLRDDPELVEMLLKAAVRRLGGRLGYPTRGVLATLAARAHRLPLAERLFRSCLNRPEGPGRLESEVYAGLLEVLQLRHKHAASVEIAKRGLAKAQQTNRLLFHRALVYAYAGLGRYKEALAAAEDAIHDSGKGQLLGSRKLKVYVLSESGKHAEAVAECESMLKEYNQGSELREVRLALSRVLLTMGKHDPSDEQLELILKEDPNDATACNDLGYHWADRNKKLDEAERLIRKAIELDSKQRLDGGIPGPDTDKENAAFVDSLGWVLFRRGKLAEARATLEKATTLPTGDDDPVVFDHLGDVYHRMKEPAKALAAWKKALALYALGTRSKTDGRYQEIQDKVRALEP